jgi:hypothetical protein
MSLFEAPVPASSAIKSFCFIDAFKPAANRRLVIRICTSKSSSSTFFGILGTFAGGSSLLGFGEFGMNLVRRHAQQGGKAYGRDGKVGKPPDRFRSRLELPTNGEHYSGQISNGVD